MNHAPYNDIAVWYDSYLHENSIYHDVVLPCLLELTGDVQGCTICDLACGQGWFARELAKRGAQVRGIDLAENLLTLARQYNGANVRKTLRLPTMLFVHTKTIFT
jgi:2-polyprenyl-3-methyl-5-hydroxy-6-metoxy-1,4-benzoquinol methylase